MLDKNAAAFGSFDPYSKHQSGFGVLQIETNPSETGNNQYYAAGFLEGYFTHQEIHNQHTNMLGIFSSLKNGPSKEFQSYITNQTAWIKQQLASHTSDAYWQQVGMIMRQYDGLIDGYNAAAPANQQLEPFAFYALNGFGDLFDLLPKYQTKSFPDFANMTKEDFHLYRQQNGHCSALVKLNGDFTELLMAHSSWFEYQFTNRIYKHYNLRSDVSVAKKISFSSYAGCLESGDDFYVTDSGLVMLQTTNSVFNKDLQKYIQPQSLLSWMRVRTALALADGGESWFSIIRRDNSGTYNNQVCLICVCVCCALCVWMCVSDCVHVCVCVCVCVCVLYSHAFTR